MFLLFSYLTARFFQSVSSALGAERVNPSYRQTDRQRGRGARGAGERGERGEQGCGRWALPVWGSRLQGEELLAIYPAEPLACSIYGNTTDIQVDPFSSPQRLLWEEEEEEEEPVAL